MFNCALTSRSSCDLSILRSVFKREAPSLITALWMRRHWSIDGGTACTLPWLHYLRELWLCGQCIGLAQWLLPTIKSFILLNRGFVGSTTGAVWCFIFVGVVCIFLSFKIDLVLNFVQRHFCHHDWHLTFWYYVDISLWFKVFQDLSGWKDLNQSC